MLLHPYPCGGDTGSVYPYPAKRWHGTCADRRKLLLLLPPPPPPPAPSSTPSLQQHAPPPPNAPQGRKNGEGGEETGQGERDEQREVTGQGRPHSPKTVQSAEGGEGKEKQERIIVVVGSPCQENYPADAHPSAHKSVLESANPAWTRSVHLDAPCQRHGQQPVSGTAKMVRVTQICPWIARIKGN